MAKNKARYNSASHKAILLRRRTFSRPADRRILTFPPARRERKREETDRLAGTATSRASACTKSLGPRRVPDALKPQSSLGHHGEHGEHADECRDDQTTPPSAARKRAIPSTTTTTTTSSRQASQATQPTSQEKRRRKKLPSETALTRPKLSLNPIPKRKTHQPASKQGGGCFFPVPFHTLQFSQAKPASRPVGRPKRVVGVCVSVLFPGNSSRTILASPRFISTSHSAPRRTGKSVLGFPGQGRTGEGMGR